jgi:hypothetical protein
VATRSVVESRPVLDISTSGIITGRLCVVASPLPFVIVAGGWPSALIALLALDLPVQSAYFPARLHRYIKPSKCAVTLWKTPSTFSYDHVSGEVIFLVSGTSAFIRGVLSSIPSEGVHRTIASVEFLHRVIWSSPAGSKDKQCYWILVCNPSISGIGIAAGLLMQSTLLVLAQGYARLYSLCLSQGLPSVCVISSMVVRR